MLLPKDFTERMRAALGDEYEAFLRSYDEKPNKGIRINTQKCADPPSAAKKLGAAKRVPWCPTGFYVGDDAPGGSHPLHIAGLFYFQEPSAMCAAEALPLCDNPRVLDLCAAPGGKTTQIGARMGGGGLLVANEIVPKRAKILAENVERMGLRNTIVTNESPERLSARFPEFFDGIIVDAPCSGEGMFRKEPQAVTEWSAAHSDACARRQRAIVSDAVKMLKPGGYLVYSTCTFAQSENEDVVSYMISELGMEPQNIPCLSMLGGGKGGFSGAEKCRRILPHRHGGEGHFAALLRRPGEALCVSSNRRQDRRGADGNLRTAEALYRKFEGETLNIELNGEFKLLGAGLYLTPEPFDAEGLRVPMCGLRLGEIRKDRFEPSHALSHALSPADFKTLVSFDSSSDTVYRYLRGEETAADIARGFCAVAADGLPLGWGKASGGVIKNKFPKGLRTKGYMTGNSKRHR